MSKRALSILLLVLFLIGGCYRAVDVSDGGVASGDIDTDIDGDADSDTDGDADSNADGDTDTGWQQGDMQFRGVDLLVVIDNSGSMDQEQAILATGFFTLINSLVNPRENWPYPPVSEIRVAFVSTDMGLQYGDSGSIEGFPYGDTAVPTCTDQDPRGDDGRFQTDMHAAVSIKSGLIECDPIGEQCPMDWSCSAGTCISPSGYADTINCPDLEAEQNWTATTDDNHTHIIAAQAACISQLGTWGCGVEQQLEAAVRSLSRNDVQQNFIREDHLLAVLIVSDEEDCSIQDKGLFNTPEWISGTAPEEYDPQRGLLNTACNLPASNETNYLFPTSRYREKIVALKNGDTKAVVFAAIVGVPTEDDSPCQGAGDTLSGCLGHEDMQLSISLFENMGAHYKHFTPACERTDGDDLITSARPGRRYVEVAQSFGKSGYIYSICNQDWNPPMNKLAVMIAERVDNRDF